MRFRNVLLASTALLTLGARAVSAGPTRIEQRTFNLDPLRLRAHGTREPEQLPGGFALHAQRYQKCSDLRG